MADFQPRKDTLTNWNSYNFAPYEWGVVVDASGNSTGQTVTGTEHGGVGNYVLGPPDTGSTDAAAIHVENEAENFNPAYQDVEAFFVSIDEVLGSGPALEHNQIPAVDNDGDPVGIELDYGFGWGIAAPAGKFLPASGSITIRAPKRAGVLSEVDVLPIGDHVNIQVLEGGAAINGFTSAVGVTTAGVQVPSN